MRWIALSEALDLIGHEQKDALRRALRAGDVKSRMRYENGAVKALDPCHWHGEIDWDGSRLAVVEFQFFVLGGNPSSPVPPQLVPVEVDRGTVLENFESRGGTQLRRELYPYPRKDEPDGLEEWYMDRTRHVAHSTRGEDLEAARERFGRWTKDQDFLRDLRRRRAPDSWKKPGPKNLA
jgi:hypothetical protein